MKFDEFIFEWIVPLIIIECVIILQVVLIMGILGVVC